MKYCAIPYDQSKAAIYFDTHEELVERAEKLGIEEYEISNIDGEYPNFFEALNVDQSDFHLWEELLDTVDEHDLPKIYHMAEHHGYTLKDLENDDRWEDELIIYEGTLEDVAQEIFDELYLHEIPEKARSYIDYDAFERDLDCEGYNEFDFNGKTYVAAPF